MFRLKMLCAISGRSQSYGTQMEGTKIPRITPNNELAQPKLRVCQPISYPVRELVASMCLGISLTPPIKAIDHLCMMRCEQYHSSSIHFNNCYTYTYILANNLYELLTVCWITIRIGQTFQFGSSRQWLCSYWLYCSNNHADGCSEWICIWRVAVHT